MNFVSTLKDRLTILSNIFTKLLRFKTTSVKTTSVKTTPTIKTEQVTQTIKPEQVTQTNKKGFASSLKIF